ncbi:MAG TPA: methyltransferase domain-containing protein [Candidatus Dormibacteraeota bacterium]|nr:methyltransferase domain-containing protein [Candidatus Dormibacteraeota bacterium]
MSQRSTGGGDWDAVAYDRLSDPQLGWGTAVLERLALAGDETVLDAGCGSGRVTQKLLERLPGGRVVALDESSTMLSEARRRLAPEGERVVFVHADLLDLTARTLHDDAPVDAVFSTATFHWIQDHERLFANLASVLRPGGRLVAQCGGAGNIAALLAIVHGLGVERAGVWNYASPHQTRSRLASAGFEDIRVWLHDEPTPFASAEQLTDYLETVCLRQSVGSMPAEQRTQLLRDVVRAMPDRIIDYVRLNIDARRSA